MILSENRYPLFGIMLALEADQRLFPPAEHQQQMPKPPSSAQLGVARMPTITGSHSKPPA